MNLSEPVTCMDWVCLFGFLAFEILGPFAGVLVYESVKQAMRRSESRASRIEREKKKALVMEYEIAQDRLRANAGKGGYRT